MNLKQIDALIIDNFDTLMDHFGVELVDRGSYLQGCCPIHSGDNQNGFSVSIKDNMLTWQCFTNGCHENFTAPGPIQLIQGLLQVDNPDIEFSQTVRWILNFLNVENVKQESEIEVSKTKRDFIKWNSDNPLVLPENIASREKSVEKLQIPANYYIDRGFSPEILVEYDIGTPKIQTGRFQKRVVVPIYSLDGNHLVGAAGRSLDDSFKPKWLYNKDFAAGNYFFNIWKAKTAIWETGNVILVEGQMDCVRFAEAGIYNTLGLFGTDMSENQFRLLNQLGVFNVILCLDNDDAGKKATTRLYNKLTRFYNVDVIKVQQNDPGDAKAEDLKITYGVYSIPNKRNQT